MNNITAINEVIATAARQHAGYIRLFDNDERMVAGFEQANDHASQAHAVAECAIRNGYVVHVTHDNDGSMVNVLFCGSTK